MSDKRLIFPCGAYFPLKDGDAHWLESAHRAKDGAYRISVYPGSQPHATEETRRRVKLRWKYELKGDRAPCLGVCPNAKRRKAERGYNDSGELRWYISCHARLFESVDEQLDGWVMNDITPPAPAKCPHCAEQWSYVQACRRAAKTGEDIPDRAKWRKCPSCNTYCEMFEDTGLCASCQLVKVVEAMSGEDH